MLQINIQPNKTSAENENASFRTNMDNQDRFMNNPNVDTKSVEPIDQMMYQANKKTEKKKKFSYVQLFLFFRRGVIASLGWKATEHTHSILQQEINGLANCRKRSEYIIFEEEEEEEELKKKEKKQGSIDPDGPQFHC